MKDLRTTIFKQREEINGRMTKMFGLLKELKTSRTPEKVLIREEVKFPVTKNVNSISLKKGEEERSNKTEVTSDNTEKPSETKTEMSVREVEAMNGAKNEAENESIKTLKNDKAVETFGSQPIAYYLKHKINEKLIKGLVKNNRFNNSLSGTQVGKKKGKAYKVLPGGPVYDSIIKKKITRKEDIGGNFEIPCTIKDLKHMNALVDQGSDVNVMPYSTYMRLTDKRPAKTDISLTLAGHSYIYPLAIAKDVLVEAAEHVFPVDFMILDIKENEKRPFILGTPFLSTAKATIKFDTGTITLRSGKSKASARMGRKNKLHIEKEMKFNQWRSNNFKNKQPAPVKVKGGMDDKGENVETVSRFTSDAVTTTPVTVPGFSGRRQMPRLYLTRRSLEVLRKFHWMILGGRFNQLSHVSSPLLSKPGEY
ncbi:MAK10-like protein [Tanacetum coccineum]